MPGSIPAPSPIRHHRIFTAPPSSSRCWPRPWQTAALLAVSITKDEFVEASRPLFDFLDKLHEHLWREGKQFPPAQAQVTQMLADSELLMSLTFNPNEPANLVANGMLPQSTIAWQHRDGTIGNTHFVAIPINARAKAAAQVTANFLLSPQAQAPQGRPQDMGRPDRARSSTSSLPPIGRCSTLRRRPAPCSIRHRQSPSRTAAGCR